MSLTVKDKRQPFQVAPEGLHIARCYAVIDLGEQFTKKYNSFLPKVWLGWELSSTVMPDGKPFIHMQSYTGSISENARLRPLLESWRGKPFTALEGKGFKLYKLLGAPCCLVIKHSFDRVSNQLWAHIIAISKLPSGVECPPPVNSPIYFDLDHYSEAAYLSVPEGIRKKINLEGVTALTQAADQEIGGEVASPASLEAEETVENFPF